MSQVKAGGAYVELTARSSQFLKGLEAAQKRLSSFGASARLVGTKLMGLVSPLRLQLQVAWQPIPVLTMRFCAPCSSQCDGCNFRISAQYGKALGATTSFSASEVASLMTELGRAGFSPSRSKK